jgi:hypothetical protein
VSFVKQAPNNPAWVGDKAQLSRVNIAPGGGQLSSPRGDRVA